jgi:gliding motility-associated-like protein
LNPTKTILLVSLIIFSIGINAQVCTGSLGDPVVTIDFGAGSNPGGPNSNVSSAYQYIGQDCPQEGFYAIRNATFSCFSGDWHILPFDHTPNDPNGYFLLVNGLAGPSLIYQQTITGLCPNITVQVDAWVMNIFKAGACSNSGIDPNLTFSITDMSGNLIAQKSTGPIPEADPQPVWTSHSFLFNAPINGSVILKITSNSQAGCGNDFAIDDITFRPCGPAITAAFTNSLASPQTICETNQQPVSMNAFYNGNYANPVFQWQISNTQGFNWTDIAGANTLNYSTVPGVIGERWYRCVVTDASFGGSPGCRFASNPVKILVVSPPFAQATNYVYGCYGSTIYFQAAGGSLYEWWGPNGFHSFAQAPAIPNVTFAATGDYIVKVTSTPGCFAYDTTAITIYAAPIATLSPRTASICEGDSVQFFAGGSVRYKWFPSTGLSNDTIPNPWAKPTSDITYSVRVYNEYTCFDSLNVNVVVWKKPRAFAGPDQYFRKNRPVQLDGGASGTNVTYSWSPPTYLDNPNYLKAIAKPPGTMTYTLTVVSNNGCGVATDDVKLEAIDKLFIPTGFNTNADGLNDKWEIVTFEDYENAVTEVYNRYGQLVYRGYAKNYKPWDGTFDGEPCLPGVYVYVLNLHNGKPILKGTLNLIR